MSKREYKAQQTSTSTQEQWGARSLPIDQTVAVYARQSTAKQVVDNRESAEMQTTELENMALRLGWEESNIVLYIENKREDGRMRSASGTLRIDQRPGLSALMERIYSGEIKAILVYSESRLFRDEFQIQVNTFIKACYDHGVRVITPTYRYDFRGNKYDTAQFRRQCEIAADYITNHVKGLLHPAKERVSLRGQYDGRMIATGYIIDRDKTSHTYKKYIPYEPHAKVIRWIFKRYRELDGRYYELGKEIAAMPYLFPLFESWVEKSKTVLTPKGNGYTLGRDGLKSVLTNVAYIGYWMYQGVVISTDNHAAIIDEVDFWYAFNRLSATKIDGTPNQEWRGAAIRYHQQGKRKSDSLLKFVLTSPQGPVYNPYMRDTWSYSIGGDGTFGDKTVAQFKAEYLDQAFIARMLHVLEDTEHGQTIQERLQVVLSTRTEAVVNVDEQIAEAHRKIARIERMLDVNSPIFDTLTDKQVADYNIEKVATQSILASLEEKKGDAINAELDIIDCQNLVDCVRTGFNSLTLEKKRRFISLITQSVVIEVVSPRWLKIEIEWTGPYGCKDVGYMWRTWGYSPAWNEEDNQVIRDLYPTADRYEIMALLPARSWAGIHTQAEKLGVHRKRNSPSSIDASKFLSLDDICFIEEKGLSTELGTQWISSSENGTGSHLPVHHYE